MNFPLIYKSLIEFYEEPLLWFNNSVTISCFFSSLLSPQTWTQLTKKSANVFSIFFFFYFTPLGILFRALCAALSRRSPHKVRRFWRPNANLNGTFIIRLPIQHIVFIAIHGHSALSVSVCLWRLLQLSVSLTERVKKEKKKRRHPQPQLCDARRSFGFYYIPLIFPD